MVKPELKYSVLEGKFDLGTKTGIVVKIENKCYGYANSEELEKDVFIKKCVKISLQKHRGEN